MALVIGACCGKASAQELLPLAQAKKQGIAICQKLVETGAYMTVNNNDHHSRST